MSATPTGFSSVTLRADEIANFDFFTSGTLRIEYWFFSSPYTGSAQFGYKTAEATLGQLLPGYSFFNVSRTVSLALPPDGYYCPSFQVTEFTLTGYRPVDWVNFSCRFIGPPPNAPPNAFFTASPTLGDAPLTVNLNASGSTDSDGFIVLYDWLASDGQTRSGVAPTLTFVSPGSYNIVLSVTDNDGARDTFSRSVTVRQPPDPCASRPSIALGATVNAALSIDDCEQLNTYLDLYTITLPAAGWLTLAMDSQVIDPLLGVATTDLTSLLASDDDSGAGTNALLTTPLSAGSYLVIATSFAAGETGPYSLTTQFQVPEPSAHELAIAALVALVGFRRSRVRRVQPAGRSA